MKVIFDNVSRLKMGKTCGLACNVYASSWKNLLIDIRIWVRMDCLFIQFCIGLHSNQYTVGTTRVFSVNKCTIMSNAQCTCPGLSVLMYLICIWMLEIGMHQFSIFVRPFICHILTYACMHLLCASVNWPKTEAKKMKSLTGSKLL